MLARLWFAALALVLIADAAAAQVEPGFDISVDLAHPEGLLNENTEYEMPVTVTLKCTAVSPLMAVENMEFGHNVSVSADGEDSFKISYLRSYLKVFAPQWCIDETEITYDFPISFRIPHDYPALTPLDFRVHVWVKNGTGEGFSYWNTTIAYKGDLDFDGPGDSHWSQAPDQMKKRFALSNNGNGAVKGLVTLAPGAPDGIRMEPFSFGPVPGGMRSSYVYYLNTSDLSVGEYSVRYQVETWLSDHPGFRLPNQTMHHYLMIGQDHEGVYVEGPMPVTPLILVLASLLVLLRRNRIIAPQDGFVSVRRGDH